LPQRGSGSVRQPLLCSHLVSPSPRLCPAMMAGWRARPVVARRGSCPGRQHLTGPAVAIRSSGHAAHGELAQTGLVGVAGHQVRHVLAIDHLGQRPPRPGRFLSRAAAVPPPRGFEMLPTHHHSLFRFCPCGMGVCRVWLIDEPSRLHPRARRTGPRVGPPEFFQPGPRPVRRSRSGGRAAGELGGSQPRSPRRERAEAPALVLSVVAAVPAPVGAQVGAPHAGPCD
jgi:hypothetical protein